VRTGLDLVGERWTLIIIKELLHSPRRYSELRHLLPGIGSNVLSDRLEELEAGCIVERLPGTVGNGVSYTLTSRRKELGPALALFRQWGLGEMLPSASSQEVTTYDPYAVPLDLELHETYEWRIDDDSFVLEIDGDQLTVYAGSA
jgi:DNA-binding HxlR family transcriptional regulator